MIAYAWPSCPSFYVVHQLLQLSHGHQPRDLLGLGFLVRLKELSIFYG